MNMTCNQNAPIDLHFPLKYDRFMFWQLPSGVKHWNTAAVFLSWNRTRTCWTLYQGSNSFGSHPLSYHSSEQRQSVCHRLGLHYSQWWSQRNGSIWESGWPTPDALAAVTWQRKISTGVEGERNKQNITTEQDITKAEIFKKQLWCTHTHASSHTHPE